LNWYLKHDALVDVSWYADDPIVVPPKLPLPPEKVSRQTPVKERFFLNYCTFGYSFPWWQWRDWERFVDWMALNGVNLVLAQGANEAVWQKVWREYGLTDEEIRGGFFSGPAHLPWNRMGNLDKWDGPLPQSYIDGQLALTKKIVARERAFGMKTVLPAFAGHVPPALQRIRPDVKLNKLNWCGVSTCFIAPQDPLFRELEVKFLREQEKLLGTDHLYGTDPFNEMRPPSMEPDNLGSVAKGIYESMTEADPQAVWVQMAWTFMSWPNRSVEGIIKGVPPGRMMLLDYFCEHVELWKRHRFFGAPFIWIYLGNFGGNTPVMGQINRVNQRLTAAMNDSSLTNFAGIGSTLEGLNNQSMYEFLFERAWAGSQCDVTNWLRAQARCRAGTADLVVESAYETFWLDVIGDRVDGKHLAGGDHQGDGSRGDTFMMVPRLASGSTRGYLGDAKEYPLAPLAEAWGKMLEANSAATTRDAYRADLVDITRLALTGIAGNLRREMYQAYQRKDVGEFKKLEAQFLELGRDLNDLLATRPNYLMGKWIAAARAWGKDSAEADYYERNARTIVTTWFGKNNSLNDYAGRDWNGLLAGFYLGRWQLYLDEMAKALETGASPDLKIDSRVADFEWQWARQTGGNFPAQSSGDAVAVSKNLFAKYGSLLVELPAVSGPYLKNATATDFFGRWRYSAQGATWEREFLADGSAKLYRNGQSAGWKGFTWTFDRGALVLKNSGGEIFERHFLQDTNTLLFTKGGWEPAKRVSAAINTP
jgi:alpha-N-acetylglucosaminidase